METYIKDNEWYKEYLIKYLSDKKLSILFVGNKSNIYKAKSMYSDYENLSADMCSSISTVYCEHEYGEANNFSFDYDLMVVLFFHRENQNTFKIQSDFFKEIASSISSNQKKRVSIAFFSSLTPNECLFYSVNSDNDIEEHFVSIPGVYPNVYEYIGRVLFIHNKYIEIDREKKNNFFVNVKSIGKK